MKHEIWEDIKGFEGSYQISNLGRVKSLDRIVKYIGTNQTGKQFPIIKHCKERIIKTYVRGSYEHVCLKAGNKSYNYSIHRLVATHFIPNPNALSIINHKDENKLNNCSDNLEWCTTKYNANYGTRNQRIKEKLIEKDEYYIPVLCYDLNNNFICRYESAEEAGRDIGISGSGITGCCRNGNNRFSAGGFKWRYERSDIDISDIKLYPLKKAIYQFSINGEYLHTYESKSEAARKIGVDVHNFAKAIKKGKAYGYIWVEEINKIEDKIKELENKELHIIQIDKQGNVVNRFKSGLAAEKYTGIDNTNISSAVNSTTKEGKLFRTAGNYYWADTNLNNNWVIDFDYKKSHGEKQICMMDLEGNPIKEFDSIADAQEYLGKPRNLTSSIYDCLNPNKNTKTAYGYRWAFIDINK